MVSGVSISARSHFFRPYRSFGAIVESEFLAAVLAYVPSSRALEVGQIHTTVGYW